MPVVGAPGSSCRRRPGGAVSPASGGRTLAAGCGPRVWQGLQTRTSCRLGSSGCSPLAGGATLVWMALLRRDFLSGPHSPHRLLCSRSRGAARRVRGTAGGTEARAGSGRGSKRVRTPRTWSLGNVTWRICLRSKLENLHSVEIYKHTLSHKLATHLAFFSLQ